jgi:hypothetical protein
MRASRPLLVAGLLLTFPDLLSAGVFDPDVLNNGATLEDYMIVVPGGEEPGGPLYTYRLGKYEITVAQMCDFLNDADLDASGPSPTRRSSNMHIKTTDAHAGTVFMDPTFSLNEMLFLIPPDPADRDIEFDVNAPPGSRYTVVPGRETHGARFTSWPGACKFCNWLTIDQGLGEVHCVYTEGPDIGDWHPVTISTADWWGKEPAHNDRVTAGRQLTDEERSTLVRSYRGYRLPMDGAPLFAPINRPDANPFNEWLKAAAFDPDAPDTLRTNAGGWQAAPDHWMYGFGRETNTAADANWRHSNDPYEGAIGATTPVDYYDGTDHGGVFPTNDTENRYGFYGMSGNVWEWIQGYGVDAEKRGTYGGSWVSTPERQAASSTYLNGLVYLADVSFGLRVLRVDGPVEYKLLADDGAAHDEFGRTVAIDGDYAVSGAHFDDDDGGGSGSAYVYHRETGGWVQQAKVTASDAAGDDRFGHQVSISGDTLIAGAYRNDDNGSESGSAYVFTRSGTTWTQQAKLTADDAAAGDWFGYSVAINGDLAVAGAHKDGDGGSSSGSAYVFRRSGTTWSQEAKLTAPDAAAGDNFGYSVAVSGDRVIVGAYGDDDGGTGTGSAFIYHWSGSSWDEEDKLTADIPQDSSGFGLSVSISGDYALVGRPWDDHAGDLSGAAYVYHRDGSTWSQQARLTADNATTYAFFGHHVSISGTRAVVGAFGADGGANAGTAYVFDFDGDTWNQTHKLLASDRLAGEQYGQAVAVSGGYVLVGAPYHGVVALKAGGAYLYELDPPRGPSNRLNVYPDGSGEHPTIQAAIDAASPGDEVVLWEGIYTGAGNRDLDYGGKAITVRGATSPDHIVIDCEGAGRGFNFITGEGPDFVVSNLTVVNGDAGGLYGGAILCEYSSPTIQGCTFDNNASGGGAVALQSSSPRIADCRMSNNSGSEGGAIRCFDGSNAYIAGCMFSGNFGGSGGAVYINGSAPMIIECSMTGNGADDAGAVYAFSSEVYLTHCLISGNTCLGEGGALYFNESSVMVANSILTGNRGARGGAVKAYQCNPTLTLCTISGNEATETGGAVCAADGSHPVVTSSVLWDNASVQGDELAVVAGAQLTIDYSIIEGGQPAAYVESGSTLYWGNGNSDADPLFNGGISDTWSVGGEYDPVHHTVTFTDWYVNWTDDEWVGHTINPDTSQTLRLLVVGNTLRTLTVRADRATIEAGSSWVSAGATFQVYNERPSLASPCINAGRNSAIPPDAADIDGDSNTTEWTPLDMDGSTRLAGCVVDIGAYEFAAPATVEIPADFDDDCDVDDADRIAFEACATAPGVPQSNPVCADARLDEDDDADGADFGLLQRCVNVDGTPADPDCME